jgi:nucleotide-binding universal stress UspA family protein
MGDVADLGAETRAVTERAVKETVGDAPVVLRIVEGHPARAILDAARDAALVVIGCRGHGGFVGALVGSVSQHVVAHAPCPVVVIRHAQAAA